MIEMYDLVVIVLVLVVVLIVVSWAFGRLGDE